MAINNFFNANPITETLANVRQVDSKPAATGFADGNIIFDKTEQKFYKAISGSWIELDFIGDDFTVNKLAFNTAATETLATGELAWNTDDETVDMHVGDAVTIQLGQEMVYHVINQTGTQIDNGTVVMANGALGASGKIKVVPAIADGSVPAKYIMGVATEDIPNGALGYVTAFGKVRGFDTSSYSIGTILYASATSSGSFTSTAPSLPNVKTTVAITLDQKNNGTIFVRPTYDDRRKTVSSISDLENVNTTENDVVYLDAGGRSGWFKWDSNPLSSEVSSDTAQGVYVAPSGEDGSNGAWVRDYSGSLNVQWFGAVGDQTTDNATAIQSAFNVVKNYGSVYFPKQGGGSGGKPSYKINSGLTLSANDVTIFSDPLSEYSEGIFTETSSLTMITVTGFGASFRDFAVFGDGSSTVFGTTKGIVFDRTSLGDAETYANIDAYVKNCVLTYHDDAITGKGRNVFVLDNTMTYCKRGVVGELHTYSGGTVSQFRGWRISGNRFHLIGVQYTSSESSEVLPASLADLDSWCIQMPQTSQQTSHLEIFNNGADFCGGGFYKGYLAGAKIHGNQTWNNSSIFVYADITDANNQTASTLHIQSIENNSIDSRTADSTSDKGYLFSSHTFYITGVDNLTIQNNVMRQAVYQHLYADSCDRLNVRNNVFLNANNLFSEDSTLRNAVTINTGASIQFCDNFIDSQVGNVYTNAVTILSASNVKIRDNSVYKVDSSASIYNVSASALMNADHDGLSWQTPSMLNGFVLNSAQSKGYRRLFNGRVEIDVKVSSGSDNTAVFSLPVGYRPSKTLTLPAVAVWTDGSDAYAQIQSGGNVVINFNSGSASEYNIRHTFEVA